jgi:DNA-binding SARP family transcriptional activator
VARLSLYLLGSPRLEVSGRPVTLETRKAVALLSYLAMVTGPVQRETLVALLWPEADKDHGRAVLRRTLYAIKRTPLGSCLRLSQDAIGLEAGVAVDARDFESELNEASRHGHPPGARCAECLDHLTRAAQFYRDEFLKGFHLRDSVNFDDWQFFESQRLQGLLTRVLERLAWCRAAFGASEEAAEAAKRWLALDPLDEKAHRMLMLLHAWSGRPAAALRQFQECVRALQAEIGAEPAEETLVLNEAIREERIPPRPGIAGGLSRPSPEEAPTGERRSVALVHVRRGGRRAPLGAEAARIVAGFGGRVIHSLPGELLAAFGIDRALEGSAEIAVRAVLHLRAVLNAESLKAGVAVGEMELRATGSVPVMEGVLLRDAARLAASAEPGQVLAGESVARLARDAVAFVPLGVIRRGVDLPARAYEVQGLLPEPHKTRGVEGREAVMVGREAEYAALQGTLVAALRGRGQLALVIGEAGIGKSRLVAELRRGAGARAACHWIEGRCLDLGSAASYWPFLDMLRALEEETAAPKTTKGSGLGDLLERLKRRGLVTRARSEQIGAVLAQLTSGTTADTLGGPEQAKQETFECMRDLLFALAAERPLVLVFEDLHWADSLSLDLITWLLDQIAEVPILLICVYRPERENRCTRLAAAGARACAGRFALVVLRDLTPGDSRGLLASLLPGYPLSATAPGGISAALEETLLERSQGNPFLLEELIRSLMEESAPAPEGAGGRTSGDGGRRPVPASVRDVILGRADRLDPRLKSLLQYASVVGPLFDNELLARAVGGAPWMESALLDLEDRGFVRQTRTVPRREYSFRHVLTQQAIYEAIIPPRRRVLHGEVARALEGQYEGRVHEVCEALGFHREKAGDIERAVDLYQMAGEKSKGRHAAAEAVLSLSKAIELLRSRPLTRERDLRELGLRVAMGTQLVLHLGHSDDRVGQNYDRARELCVSTGDEGPLFQILLGTRRFALGRGDTRRSLETSKELIRRARGGTERSRAHMMMEETLVQTGRFHEALVHADKVLETHGPGEGEAQIRLFGNDAAVGADAFAALALWATGRIDAAASRSDRAIDAARQLGVPFNLVAALYYGCLVRKLLREPALVRQHAEEVVTIARERGFRMFSIFAAGSLAWSQAHSGDPEGGAASARAAVESARPHGVSMSLFHLPVLADVCLLSGALQEGLAAANEALGLSEDTGQVFFQSELYRVRAELLAAQGDGEEALTSVERALEVARQQGALAFELRAATTAARIQAGLTGPGRDEALENLARTYARLAEGRDTDDLRDARKLLGSEAGRDGTRVSPSAATSTHPLRQRRAPDRETEGETPARARAARRAGQGKPCA